MPVEKTKRLSASALRSARARFRAIEPLLKFQWAKSQGNLILLRSPGSETATKTELLLLRARETGIHEDTLSRWLSRFCDSGLSGLRRSPRSDRGSSRVFRRNPAAVELATFGVGLGLNAGEIFRTLLCEWKEIGDGGRAPYRNTVLRFVKLVRAARAKAIV